MGYEHNQDDIELFKVLASLTEVKDVENFLDDICTINEIKDMSNRLKAAYLLAEKKKYTEITQLTGVSSATLSRINKCINYGSGGYKKILKGVINNEK